MISFDEEAKKASKCFLCDGKPECVAACPALALRYVGWQDLTRDTPVRRTAAAALRDSKAEGCAVCH